MSSTDRQARMPDPTVKCFNVSVVGLPSNKLQFHGMPRKAKLAQGVGKSYLCERFLRSGMADGHSFGRQSQVNERHSSVMGKRRFEKEGEICSEHYFYHGSVTKAARQHGLVAFHVVEHTTFVNSKRKERMSSVSGGKKKVQVDYVVRATTAKLACPGKTSCCSGGEPFPSEFSVDAFLFAVDVTQDEENIVLQLDLLADVSSRVANLGKPLAVALTKCDFMPDSVVVEMEKRVRTTVKGVSVCQLSARTGVGVDAAFALVYEESVSEGDPLPGPLSYSASKTAKFVAERTAIRDVRKLLESATDFSITWEEFLEARDGSREACLYAVLSFQGPEACLQLFQQRLQVIQVEKLKRSLREAMLAHPNMKNVDVDQFERSVFQERKILVEDDTEDIDHLFEQYKLPTDKGTRGKVSREAKIYYKNAVLGSRSSTCKWSPRRFLSPDDCEPGSRDVSKEDEYSTYIDVVGEENATDDLYDYEDMEPGEEDGRIKDSSTTKQLDKPVGCMDMISLRTALSRNRRKNSPQAREDDSPTPYTKLGNKRQQQSVAREVISRSFSNDNGKDDETYEVMSPTESLPSTAASNTQYGWSNLDATSSPQRSTENAGQGVGKSKKSWPQKGISETFHQWHQERKAKKVPAPYHLSKTGVDGKSTEASEVLYDDVINPDAQLEIYEELVTVLKETDGIGVDILKSSTSQGDNVQPAEGNPSCSLRRGSFVSSTQANEEPPPLPKRPMASTEFKSPTVLATS